MDPATALGAGVTTLDSLNKIGGAVAVFLGLLVALSVVAIVLAIKAFRHLSTRLGAIEDSRVALLTGCITENTTACRAMSHDIREIKTEVIRQTDTIDQQTAAMRTRPCLIESGVHQRTALPQMRT